MLELRLAPLWAALGWLGVALAVTLSLWPGGVALPISVWDKLQHLSGYFLLTLWFAGLYPRERYLRIGGAVFLLGVAIELLQALTSSRSAEPGDALANALGIALALLLAYGPLGGWAQALERRAGLVPR